MVGGTSDNDFYIIYYIYVSDEIGRPFFSASFCLPE